MVFRINIFDRILLSKIDVGLKKLYVATKNEDYDFLRGVFTQSSIQML